MHELVKELSASKEKRSAAFEGFCKGLLGASTGSDDLNAFRLPGSGKFDNFLFIFFICLGRFSFDLGL